MTRPFATALDLLVSGRIGLILIIAFAASIAVAGTVYFALGKTKLAGFGHAAVPVGFLAGFFLFLGFPPFPSSDPLHLLPYVILFGLLAGLIIDSFAEVEIVRLAVVLGWPAVIVVAIGWREMPEFATFAGLPMALLWLSFVLTHLWLGLEHKPMTPLIAQFAVTIGIGVLALIAGSKIISVLAAILAVAMLGFLGWNYPRPRFPFGGTANLGATGAILALAATLVLYTNAPVIAVAVLMLVLAVAPFASRLPLGANAVVGPFISLLVCVIPVAIAAALAVSA
jgi:hypothetical protein